MEKELQDALRKLKKRDVTTFAAKVLSVDKDKGTCEVTDEELNYTDVQLAAVIDGSKAKFYLFPKVGSSVLVSPINEDVHRLYVEAYSEIESMEVQVANTQFALDKNQFKVKQEQVQFQLDKEGFLLKKENETLKKLMVDLIGAIKAMSFSLATPDTINGTTTSLLNTAQFIAIETRFNQFLKDN